MPLPLLRIFDVARHWAGWSAAGWGIKHTVRWLSLHTGVPALVVAAVLVAVGWRLLKRTARFAMEIAVVAALLLAATELGWIQW